MSFRTAILLLSLVGGCVTPRWRHLPHDQPFQRTLRPTLHSAPASRQPSEWWETVRQSTLRPLAELVSPGRHIRRLAGGAPALDINAFGQVPDSGWFENRAGKRPVSVKELKAGPCRCKSPGPAGGPLKVLGGKTEGASPGFVVRDHAGVQWLVKFDPPAFPELASGAEVISTRLLHAAGYHVPDNHVVLLDPRRLSLSRDATTRDDYNRVVPFTEKDLKEMIALLNPTPAGEVRALFSRYLPGQSLGPFSFFGLRTDDPNDRIPHERRRSLRGLWVFAAWLNHTEAWQINTLDTFITVDPARRLGYVRHHLLDFGSTLGSAGTDPKPTTSGYSLFVNWVTIGKRLAALGFYYPYWLQVRKSPYRSVGVFESEVFDPGRWRPDLPNPAFDAATIHDTYWAGSILARITPELVAEAVKTAGFSEPGAERHVIRTLLKRRGKLLRHAFKPVLALDAPSVAKTVVGLEDLEVEAGLTAKGLCYQWQARWNRDGAVDRELGRGATRSPSVDLAHIIRKAQKIDEFKQDPFITLTWWRMRQDLPSPAVELHLRVSGRRLVVVGLVRKTH